MADISDWRSVVTLIVFILANVFVVFPQNVPVPIWAARRLRSLLARTRIYPLPAPAADDSSDNMTGRDPAKMSIPFNFVTAPLTAVVVLLAIRAIGRTEIIHGIIGTEHIHPIDIMAFFLALAYLAISLDATGLIRFLAFWVLKKGGKIGHRLYFLIYLFFFLLGSFIGNDPIILSGTAFTAYLTRVASNIANPRAWIFSEFAIANMASAILVSSNPTNLVLAGAFQIKFVTYTINMVVPVVITVALLFPFLLYILFPSPDLIPVKIEMHELPEKPQTAPRNRIGRTASTNKAKGPKIGKTRVEQELYDLEWQNEYPLEELVDPFLEVKGAIFGGVLFAITLIVLLATNAADVDPGVYAITVPAAFVMLCRDIGYDWHHRKDPDRKEGATALAQQTGVKQGRYPQEQATSTTSATIGSRGTPAEDQASIDTYVSTGTNREPERHSPGSTPVSETASSSGEFTPHNNGFLRPPSPVLPSPPFPQPEPYHHLVLPGQDITAVCDREQAHSDLASTLRKDPGVHPQTAYSVLIAAGLYSESKLPTVAAVVKHLPFALVPFAFSMFIIVEGLVTKGWVERFASGWAIWVDKTNIVGAIGGIGFLSVCLCNMAGTNIGTTILLSRVLQEWLKHHTPSERMKDATIYGLALGVNYGAFSATFNASLAGLLWRDILARKHIIVRRLDFARVNLPIIAIAMGIGCSILTAQVYIVKDGHIPACKAHSPMHIDSNGTCR
ncbi:hypothetical protein PUNSTDRAFT_105417 [Punctularia strigosozonata HHB-11173 SS5]|uniref:uncharacterized protein n=1 Tax=Punctularia strigosozonata (strain HHB-11173) TaxID=741275 RepID=UPI0004416AC8|nr:uncharacterized protein PUNSTDRAFT_105417 [Punctularia strigosozonata HHB-11173 SS5]EIN06426.1 hypothetical protein PUNSTDRAFT_105417 [Punctularia strigosozonata HHB-11173 SS5]